MQTIRVGVHKRYKTYEAFYSMLLSVTQSVSI